MTPRARRCIIAVSIGAVASPCDATPQALALTITDSFASNYYYHDLVTRPFADLVARYSRGRITVSLRPGDPTGAGGAMLAALQRNIEIGTLAPDNIPGRMPLLQLAEYAGWNASTCARTKRLMLMSAPGRLIARSDFEANGLHRILVFLYPDYPVVQRRDAYSFSGRRIRTTTVGGDELMRALGAEPVRIPNVDAIPEAVAANRVDGVLLPYRAVASGSLAETLRSGTAEVSFGSVILTYAMSETRWRAIPKPLQHALERAARKVSATSCSLIDATRRAGIGSARSAGIEMTDLPRDQEQKLERHIADVRSAAAARLDQQGLSGTRALRQFDAAKF